MPRRSRERVLSILQRRGGGAVAYDALGSRPVVDLIDSMSLPDAWRTYLRQGEIRYVELAPPSGDREVFGDFIPGLPENAQLSCWGVGRIAQASMFARAGVDVIRIGDDIATQEALMVSPAMYRERIKPHHAAIIRAAHEIDPDLPVSYHSDGRLTALLPDLIDIGVTAINPVQPECMDLAEMKRTFGDRLTLWGCTPVQSLYAHGSEDDVRRHTRFLLTELAADRGLIIQFMNIVLTPHVLGNLRAFFDEFARTMERPSHSHST